MINVWLADLTMILHLLFVLYVLFGALLSFIWPRSTWVHLVAVVWGVVVNMTGWFCPLTPIENYFRQRAGAEGIGNGFLEHYLGPIIYPQGIPENAGLIVGLFALSWNVVIYFFVWLTRRSRKGS